MNSLTSSQYETILEVNRSTDWSFDHLVSISGLDKARDFRFGDFAGLDLRGTDLRGFDFTGSDLRGCVIDSKTIIDGSTILAGADIDWRLEEKTPIYQKMLEVERFSNHSKRRAALEQLASQYDSAAHIHLFLKNAIDQTRSIDFFFDALDFFEARTHDEELLISRRLLQFTMETVRIGRKRGAQTHSPSSLTSLLKRMAESGNHTIRSFYIRYLESSETFGRVSINSNKYDVTADLMRLVEIIEKPVIQVRDDWRISQ